mgnify:CR=1 FL=1
MSSPKTRSFEVDISEYPFKSNWFDRDGSLMHYVDEGSGMPVVMLHGNPTWSFLYRNIIKNLDDRFRCIAPDYPGFGFSDHPNDYGYTPQEHAEWIERLVDELTMDEFILVCQDWGGPIGLSVALQEPKRVAGIVLANTWCWPLKTLKTRLFSIAMGSNFPGKYLQLNRNYFARSVVPSGISKPEKRTHDILKHYTSPFPDKKSRMGTWVFPRALRTEQKWLQSLEQKLYRLKDTPVQLVWGMKDPAFGNEKYIKHWMEHFPDAGVTKIDDASHYIQEDRPDAIVTGINRIYQQAEPITNNN